MPDKHAVLRHEVPSDQIIRYTWVERVCHWGVAFSYIYCGLTGLAFFTPYLYILVVLFGGGPTARFWHPFVGLVYVAFMLWMNSMWREDFKRIPEDDAWDKKVKLYITNHDEELPPQGRFDSGQKIFFRGMAWMTVLVFLSGLLLWVPEYVPRSLHWALPVVAFIHSGAALITIGLVMIHIYMGTVIVPRSWRAMTLGWVSRGWGMLHAPLWYQKITSGEKGK